MSDAVSVEKLTRVYIKMRAKKDALTAELNAQLGELDKSMKQVKSAILEHMKEVGATSIKTEAGTVSRTVKTVYTPMDWESMNRFIIEHQALELLEKRIHQGNMKAFLEENPDTIPPGLSANSEYTVTIRRSKNG
jgi:hypothetical protein